MNLIKQADALNKEYALASNPYGYFETSDKSYSPENLAHLIDIIETCDKNQLPRPIYHEDVYKVKELNFNFISFLAAHDRIHVNNRNGFDPEGELNTNWEHYFSL